MPITPFTLPPQPARPPTLDATSGPAYGQAMQNWAGQARTAAQTYADQLRASNPGWQGAVGVPPIVPGNIPQWNGGTDIDTHGIPGLGTSGGLMTPGSSPQTGAQLSAPYAQWLQNMMANRAAGVPLQTPP